MSRNKTISAKELRQLYDVSGNTWAEWLRPLVKKKKIKPYTKKYKPIQIKMIFELIGPPPEA